MFLEATRRGAMVSSFGLQLTEQRVLCRRAGFSSLATLPRRRFRRKEEWSSYFHALGVEWPRTQPLPLEERTRRSAQNNSANDAAEFVESTVQKLTSGYEFFRLPRCSRATFLVRRRDCAIPETTGEASADGLWQAIQVKSALKRNKRESNSYHFAGTGSGPDCDTGIALVCVPQQKLEFLVGNGLSVQYAGGRQYWMTRCDIESVSACNDVGCSRVRENFEHLLFQLPKKSLSDWIRRLANRAQDRVHQLLILRLSQEIEKRLCVELLCLGSYTNASNATVFGKRVLLRCGRLSSKTGKGKVRLERRRSVDGKRFDFPFDASEDDVDLFIILLHRGKLSDQLAGIFVFPKRFLMEENIISANYVGGRRELVLYPPGCKAVSHHRQEFARKQCQYFLSFEDTSWTFGAGDHITEKLRSLLMCQ
ncbi:unnamed protein product [Amoebophrya sp. A25]|nr:unnamed protein product [Amoebophrya sp. A25]|eukprot:GSA25T00009145001.1